MRSSRSRSYTKTVIACCALLLGACHGPRTPLVHGATGYTQAGAGGAWLSPGSVMARHADPETPPAAPAVPFERTWVYAALLVAGLLTAFTGLAFIKFYALSRSLQAEIQARRTLEEELKELAITDPGTEVMNRRGLFQAIEEALALGITPLSLLIIDLDHFKRVNDTHGHACGDHVLREFVRICMEIVRADDVVGRLGGEEFAIVLSRTGADEARRIAERIRRSVEQSVILAPKGGVIEMTVSAGLAVHRPDEALDAFMSRADGAMYEAKCLGRNRVVVAAEFNQTARLERQRARTRGQPHHPDRRGNDPASR